MSGLKIPLNINLMDYHLAFANISVLLDNPSWTKIILTLPTIILFGVIFQCIIGHDGNDLGIFGKLICAIKCVLLGCCDFAREVYKGAVRGLSRCSCSDVRNSDVRYTCCSPHYHLISVEIYFSGSNHYTSTGIVVRTTKINFHIKEAKEQRFTV